MAGSPPQQFGPYGVRVVGEFEQVLSEDRARDAKTQKNVVTGVCLMLSVLLIVAVILLIVLKPG
jgi:type IV secretory pathway component VirB8